MDWKLALGTALILACGFAVSFAGDFLYRYQLYSSWPGFLLTMVIGVGLILFLRWLLAKLD